MSSSAAVGVDAARLIDATLGLGPIIAEMKAEIDRERRLPISLVEQLQDLGFFSLWLARDFGGYELSLSDYIRIVEAVCYQDGSVGWCVAVAAPYSRLSGFLPGSVAHSILIGDRALVAGALTPVGKAVPVRDGYRVTGHWSYGSGIRHSNWALGGCVVMEGDTPRRRLNGSIEAKVLLFPSSAVEVIDTWNVSGLRGTGSHDYRVSDLFVPATHAVSSEMDEPLLPGALFALPRHTALGVAIAAAPLGIARRALDELRIIGSAKTPRIGSVLLRDKPVFQAAVGRAEALLRAARAFLFEVSDDAWQTASAGIQLTLEQRAIVRLAVAQVAEASKTVVQIAYDAGGGASVYQSDPLQRCFQDVHAAVQHFQVQSGNYETGGRVLLGLEPGTPVF